MDDAKLRSFSSTSDDMIVLSWEEYFKLINILYTQITVYTPFNIDYIFGVPRGGLIPATILSHSLDMPIISNFMDVDRDKVVLLVDDIIDTGKTVKSLLDLRNNKNILVATIYKHKKCDIHPDFFVTENACWVRFPMKRFKNRIRINLYRDKRFITSWKYDAVLDFLHSEMKASDFYNLRRLEPRRSKITYYLNYALKILLLKEKFKVRQNVVHNMINRSGGLGETSSTGSRYYRDEDLSPSWENMINALEDINE